MDPKLSSVVDAKKASNFEAAAGGSAPDQKYGLAAEVPLEGNQRVSIAGTSWWVGVDDLCGETAQISGTTLKQVHKKHEHR